MFMHCEDYFHCQVRCSRCRWFYYWAENICIYKRGRAAKQVWEPLLYFNFLCHFYIFSECPHGEEFRKQWNVWDSGFENRSFCFFSDREPSWSANQISAFPIASIELVPRCWKGRAFVLTVERRPARLRRSPSRRLIPPPLSHLRLSTEVPQPRFPRAVLTPLLAGKIFNRGSEAVMAINQAINIW